MSWHQMGPPGAGSGGDIGVAWDRVIRDVMAGLIPVSEVDTYYALYRAGQIAERQAALCPRCRRRLIRPGSPMCARCVHEL